MPDFYPPGEYDLAGFIVGAVEKQKQLDPRRVRAGDMLMALPSSGLHTNGYSLARKLVFGVAKLKPDTYVAEITQQNRRGTAETAPRLLAAAEKCAGARLGFFHGAHHRRRNHRESSARAAAKRSGGRRAGLVAGAADFRYLAQNWKNGARRIAADVQSGRGNDSGGSAEACFARGSGIEAPPREILSGRPHRELQSRHARAWCIRASSLCKADPVGYSNCGVGLSFVLRLCSVTDSTD